MKVSCPQAGLKTIPDSERNQKLAAARAALAAKGAAAKTPTALVTELDTLLPGFKAASDEHVKATKKATTKKASKREIASAASIGNAEIASKLQSRHATKAAAVKPAASAFSGPTPVPAGEKFCPYHQTSPPVADFASNKPAKDHLYYICRKPESEKRAAKLAAPTASPAA